MKSKIRIFETNKLEGTFSRNKKFYPANITDSEITEQFLEVKKRAGEKFGFDPTRVFQPRQKTATNGIDYPDNKYIEIEDKHLEVEDCFFNLPECDILVIREKYKGIVVGNQMSDCPIVLIEDRRQGVTALAHCGGPYIDRMLPLYIGKTLIDNYNSNPEDLYAYVGSCIKKESYKYDRYPAWATNKELWFNSIEEKDGYFYIDLNKPIREMLQSIGITNIEESPIDTFTNDDYASHAAFALGNKDKLGQNFVGFYYE